MSPQNSSRWMRWLAPLALAAVAIVACAVAPPTPTAAPAQAPPVVRVVVAATPVPTAAPTPAPSTAPGPTAATGLPATAQSPAQANSPLVRLRSANGATHQVRVELAATVAQRTRGLMARPSMPEDAGMLFVFPADTDGPFWMKDTLLPLSIAFIAADGTIVNVQDMQPMTTDLHAPGARYRYALEVNQGFFARAGIRVGDRAELPPLPPAS